MNNETAPSEREPELSFQERIEILFYEIELAVRWERPSILFAIYRSEEIRDQANSLFREQLKSIGQSTHTIKTDPASHFDFLAHLPDLADLTRTVLVIEGFNWECGSEGVSVLQEFNKHREYFIDNNIRAIFWLYENEVSQFAANATECWILRHRVVEFVDLPAEENELDQTLESLWQNAETQPNQAVPAVEICPEMPEASRTTTEANTKAYLSLGILLWRKGKPRQAIGHLQNSAEMATTLGDHALQAQCQNAMALVLSELGEIDEAVNAYQRAISLAPESEFLWNNLGQLLAKNERNEEAIHAFKNALSCSPQDFLSWDGIGHIFIKLGLVQNAIRAFAKALEVAPYYEFSQAGIGRAYMQAGQLEEARGALCKAVELNVHYIEAWLDLGKCLDQSQRDADAISVYHRAIEFNPDSAPIWDALGKLHQKRQDYAESISAYQKVISLKPKCGQARARLAEGLFQIGDFEAAATTFAESLALFADLSSRAAICNRLGDAFSHMKDYEHAITAYQQAEEMEKELKVPEMETPAVVEETSADLAQETLPAEDGDHIEERGEVMNEANRVFDSRTAREWNELGNRNLKVGAYNDAIVAYTKAIELAPDSGWAYIQNLANVHYQKGKVRGKMPEAQTHDPDVWEGDEEQDTTPLFGMEDLPEPERGDPVEEPIIEALPLAEPTLLEPQPAGEAAQLDMSIMAAIDCCAQAGDLAAGETFAQAIVEQVSTESEPEADVKAEAEVVAEVEAEAAPVDDAPETISAAMARLGVRPLDLPLQSGAFPLELGGLEPRNSIDWNELGNTYMQEKHFDKASEAYKHAIEMNPNYGQPYSNLGFIYYHLGKFDTAIMLLKKSIDLLESVEDRAISWNRLGDAYRRQGDYGSALAAYKQSSETVTPVNPMLARARATLLENAVAG